MDGADAKVTLESFQGVLMALLGCLDAEKLKALMGERIVVFSDDTENPELYAEVIMLEETHECIHPKVTLYRGRGAAAYLPGVGYDPIIWNNQ